MHGARLQQAPCPIHCSLYSNIFCIVICLYNKLLVYKRQKKGGKKRSGKEETLLPPPAR
jgi:hypothetical protein